MAISSCCQLGSMTSRARLSVCSTSPTHRADHARTSAVQRLHILLHLLVVDECALVARAREGHVEHPLGLHAQLALDHLDEVFVVGAVVCLFEEVDLLVGPAEEDLGQEVLVCAETLARPVEEVDVSWQGAEGFKNEYELEPNNISLGEIEL